MAIAKSARVLIGQVNKQFGKIRKTKPTEYINSTFNHLTREEKAITACNKRVLLAQMEVVPKAVQGMGDLIFPGAQFNVKKAKLLEFAQKTGDKKLLKQITGAQNGDDLYKVCADYNMGLVKSVENTSWNYNGWQQR